MNVADVASAYAEFKATSGKDVVVEIRRHATATADDAALKRIVLNGLELDTVDPTKKATKPSPASGDEHVPPSPILVWQKAKGAVSHDLYLGTDHEAVANATRDSQEFANGGNVSGDAKAEFDTAQLSSSF